MVVERVEVFEDGVEVEIVVDDVVAMVLEHGETDEDVIVVVGVLVRIAEENDPKTHDISENKFAFEETENPAETEEEIESIFLLEKAIKIIFQIFDELTKECELRMHSLLILIEIMHQSSLHQTHKTPKNNPIIVILQNKQQRSHQIRHPLFFFFFFTSPERRISQSEIR